MLNICVTILYVAVFLEVTEGQHVHKPISTGGTEQYGIELVIHGANNPQWTIEKANSVVTSINRYVQENPQQQLGNGNGYQGYKVDHKVNGVSQHTWIIPKCGDTKLERDIFKTAPQATKNAYQNTLNAALNTCPKPKVK